MKNEEKKELNDKEAEQVTGGTSVEETAEQKAKKLTEMIAEKAAEKQKTPTISVRIVASDLKAAEVE